MSESDRMPAEDRSVTSVVDVAIEPETAFRAFTEELDLWWVRGPINHHAGGRVLAMRCEPGVGGRAVDPRLRRQEGRPRRRRSSRGAHQGGSQGTEPAGRAVTTRARRAWCTSSVPESR